MQGPKAALKAMISHFRLAMSATVKELFRFAPLAVASVLLAGTVPCVANDTSASIDAGGLVFRQSADIEMKSEVLTISPETVEVDYVFFNKSAKDIATPVAFPLPDLALAEMWHSPVSVPFRGQQNYVGFKTWVDGKEIAARSEVHAVLEDGRDIAGDLGRLGVNIFAEQQAYSPEAKAALLKLGALVDGGYGDIFPVWVAKTSFYWTQTFPAGKELRVKHRYSAGPLRRLVRADEPEWCTDAAHKAAFAALPKVEGDYLDGKAVRYVLKTGANSAGPIGDFTLRIDKGGAALVSTCPIPGLTLTRDGHAFVAHARNFTPAADLNVLFAFAGRK